MFKHLFNRNKVPKQSHQEVVAAPKKEMAEVIAPAGSNKGKGGTVLRSSEPAETSEKNKSLLQLAEEGSWKVTEVPEYHVGDTIDDIYKIANKFSGGMGFVYITEPTGQGIRFAIKQPKREMLQNKNFFARIIREADTWNSLGMHPNIAYCYFVKPVDNVPCIFIEYVDGGNLREWIAEGECLDIRASLNMAIQFCHGMEHAHQRGAIHRDIKPENVLMTKEGRVKITDFGLAGAVEKEAGKGVIKADSPLTQFGDVMGTEAYMAPEQWEDPHNVDARADIFSFGVCMWEMFCGKRPYKIAYGSDIETPTPAKTLRPELTDSHIKLLYKSIELDKEKRYKDFTELREALNNIYRELYHEDALDYGIILPDSLADELNNRGYSCYQLGDKQKARQCWEDALKTAPKHLEANYNLNHLKWDNGEITGDELLRQMELTEDRSPQYWLCVGWVYYEQGDQEAIQKIQDSENRITEPQFLEALEHPDRPLGKIIRKVERHTDSVNSVCFSPDGKYILSRSADYTLRLCEVTTGSELWRLSGYIYSVLSACFSPDGRYILSGGRDKAIRLWETGTRKEIRAFKGHTDSVNSACYSPDGRFILSGSSDGTIRLWDVATGKEIQWFVADTETSFNLRSPGADVAGIWKKRQRFAGHTNDVNSVLFSPDGRYILSVSWDYTILWDIAKGKEIRRFIAGSGRVLSVSFSPDGKFVLSGNENSIIQLWDAATGEEIREFKGHTNPVGSVCYSPDGRYILSGSRDKTILWNAATGKEVYKFKHTELITSVCFSPDGRYILSGSYDRTIRLYPVNNNILNFPILSALHTSEELIRLQKKVNLLFNDAKSTKKSGNYKNAIAILRQIQGLSRYEQKPELLDFITTCSREGQGFPIGLRSVSIRKKFEGHMKTINSVCLSPDGRFVLSGSGDKTIRLWEVAPGKKIQRFEGHTSEVNSVCFSPDGRFVLSGGGDGTIRLWEVYTGEEIRRFEEHTWGGVNSVYFSPNGRFVLSGGADHTIHLWDVYVGKEIQRFEGHTGWVNSVCFSPDGGFVMSGSLDGIRLWDTITGKEIRWFFEGHINHVNSVCFSPDGKFVLSGGLDIRLWDATTGKEIRTFEGITYGGLSVCFSQDGRYVLSGGGRSIKLWNTSAGKEIRKFEGHTGFVNSVCFSQDGRYVLSGSSDHTIILWELDWEWEFPEEKA